ncbi:hypothetical protein P7C70_g5246, partial [Phenoliferia sp. Uapishka_3]
MDKVFPELVDHIITLGASTCPPVRTHSALPYSDWTTLAPKTQTNPSSRDFLLSCSLVCRSWGVLAQNALLRNVQVSGGNWARQLAQALREGDGAAARVQTLWVNTLAGDEDGVVALLKLCTNARRFCWTSRDPHLTRSQPTPLRFLSCATSITALTLDKAIIHSELLVHSLPALVELHLTRCTFNNDTEATLEIFPDSPISSLRVVDDRIGPQDSRNDPLPFLIHSKRRTLKSLELDGHNRGPWRPRLALSLLEGLDSLKITFDYLDYQPVISTHHSQQSSILFSPSHDLQPLPASLEHLQIVDEDFRSIQNWYTTHLEACDDPRERRVRSEVAFCAYCTTALPMLRTLVIPIEPTTQMDRSSAGTELRPDWTRSGEVQVTFELRVGSSYGFPVA